MIIDLFKENSMNGSSLHLYEIGILVDSHLQLVTVWASLWKINNETLVFFCEKEEKIIQAIFKSWCYVRRIQRTDFINSVVITKEFVKNQISCARKTPSLIKGREMDLKNEKETLC